MALPLLIPSMAGAVTAGLTAFIASRGAMILAGLGLTFIGVKGFQSVIGYAISGIQGVVSSASGDGGGLGSQMLQMAAYAGLFDGINIILAAYTAWASLLAVRFIVGRLRS